MSKTRISLLVTHAIALVSLAGCATREPALKIGEERVLFTGTVEMVEPLGRREATAYLVGVDPRFLLVVHVNSVERNESSPIAPNRSITFGIHSPSRLFALEDPVGKEFRFKATWVFAPEGHEHFSWIEARLGGTEDR